MPDVMKTLLLNPPSFENFDGGASSRWPATREIESYWYPVWLAYPAGMTAHQPIEPSRRDNSSTSSSISVELMLFLRSLDRTKSRSLGWIA